MHSSLRSRALGAALVLGFACLLRPPGTAVADEAGAGPGGRSVSAEPAPTEAGPRPRPDDGAAHERHCGPLEPGAYPWLERMDVAADSLAPLCAHWSPPDGYRRVHLDEGTFGAWLRRLPLRTDRRTVRAYDGRPVRAPSAGVVALDLLRGDVQQCADTILRLHAEHAWHADRMDDAVYHFTSGDAVAWSDWIAGERYRVDGARVRRVRGPPRARTRQAFRRWQRRLFLYAGTRSLRFDSEPVPSEGSLRPGDFFVAPGSPGHALILLDVVSGPEGDRLALVGQGFMPAQELHVLRGQGGGDVVDRVWFRLPEAGGSLNTPGWAPFRRRAARRF